MTALRPGSPVTSPRNKIFSIRFFLIQMAGLQQGQKRAAEKGLALAAAFLLIMGGVAAGQRLSALAPPPDWSQLDAFQETITRDEFARLLDTVYAPGGVSEPYVRIKPEAAVIEKTVTPPTYFTLRFAASDQVAKPPPRYWTPARSLPPLVSTERPLEGVKVALDPGIWEARGRRWRRDGSRSAAANRSPRAI